MLLLTQTVFTARPDKFTVEARVAGCAPALVALSLRSRKAGSSVVTRPELARRAVDDVDRFERVGAETDLFTPDQQTTDTTCEI